MAPLVHFFPPVPTGNRAHQTNTLNIANVVSLDFLQSVRRGAVNRRVRTGPQTLFLFKPKKHCATLHPMGGSADSQCGEVRKGATR
jgi:hypothetical protein